MKNEKNMENLYDAVIVGGGPAGLSAAIYLARARYRVLVLEKEKFGGQITITSEIVNYPGITKTSGSALTEAMRRQAASFGAEFALGRAERIITDSDFKNVVTDSGEEYRSLGLVLALGANPRKVGFRGEEEFQGRGVAYCATCDGEFFTGKEVLVIGGGFAAVEESMFLTKYASRVTILVRGSSFSCAASAVEKLKKYPKITVRFRTELIEASGEGLVSRALLRNNETGEVTEYRASDGGSFGIFVFAGYVPATAVVKGSVALDSQGCILTDRNQKTDRDGVYAAGDVCAKELRQVVTAVSDGAVAATSLEKHISEQHEKLGLPEFAQRGVAADAGDEAPAAPADDGEGAPERDSSFISVPIRAQLKGVFAKFERPVTVTAVLGTDKAASELEGFAREIGSVHENVATTIEKTGTERSFLDIRTGDDSAGIRFFSVPGGHEFNSFIVALYNAAGPGQKLRDAVLKRIKRLEKPHLLQVMTTLSCTNCPEVVMGAQRIASLAPGVEAEMYDLAKFPEIKAKYSIMAVPCLIIDGRSVHFGKRGVEEILDLVEKA